MSKVDEYMGNLNLWDLEKNKKALLAHLLERLPNKSAYHPHGALDYDDYKTGWDSCLTEVKKMLEEEFK